MLKNKVVKNFCLLQIKAKEMLSTVFVLLTSSLIPFVEIGAVVVFVEFLMRNCDWQVIHLSIGEFCWNWTFLEQVTQL